MSQNYKDFPFRGVLSLKRLIDYVDQAEANSHEKAPFQVGNLRERLEQAPELREPIEDDTVLERHKDLVQGLMGLVFPSAYWESQAFAAVVPYSMKPFLISPKFRQFFFDEDGLFKVKSNIDEKMFHRGRAIRAYLFILKKFYDVSENMQYPILYKVLDPDTELERHFKMNFDFRFVEAHAVREPKAVSPGELSFILEHLAEPELLRDILPPEDFELHGFTVIQAVDVTESEILSALERDLIDQQSIVSQPGFLRLQQRLRTLFRRPNIVAGLAAIQKDEVLLLNSGCEMSRSCIFADSRHVPMSEFKDTLYERASQGEEILRVPDVLNVPSPGRVEREIAEMGIRSLLIAPLHYKGECVGTLELGSPEPGDLGPVDELLMRNIQPLFSMAIKRALDDFDHRVEGIIKQECTAIHPVVEWRFRKAAVNLLENQRAGGSAEIEPIVFKDVYPLYGFSDIRGSSEARNSAIQKDLERHLRMALDVARLANEARPLLILQELEGRIDGHLKRIHNGLLTGDEISIVRFLRNEVESVFTHLMNFGPKVIRAIDTYKGAIDPKTGTVYRLRKDFEDSVSLLNETLADHLDREEAGAQGVFPHYFERHRTDGVDYLIYMGSALLENEEFNELYLRNLRLWQLKIACGMAWHTEQLKTSLKVPLDTAHLILVQHAPLSVRFRFDEKRFDVDGAYDIRHEIIKSRVDKSVVKGGRERLTQPGKIAVVYSHAEEAREMRQHIHFLQSEGYLKGEVESLELEDLPGVQGLKALRVGVNLESQALSARVQSGLG